MNSLRLTAPLALSLLAGACVASVDGTTRDDSASDSGTARSADNGTVNLPLTVLDVDVSRAYDEPTILPLITAEDFVDTFGVQPPPSVDFSREWVLFFAGSDQAAGGCASIDKVQHTPSTRHLKIVTKVGPAAPGCRTFGDIGRPYTIVAVPTVTPEPLSFDFEEIRGEQRGDRPTGEPGNACAGNRGGALITFEVGVEDPESFVAWITDEAFITEAERVANLPAPQPGEDAPFLPSPSFKLVDGSTCDARYSFSVDPNDADYSGLCVELYDSLPSYVDETKAEWLEKDLRWCPWGPRVVSVVRQ
jgi:hypothetical protein